MAIPDYQSVMLPFLRLHSDGNVHSSRDVAKLLASEFDLTERELEETIPSGRSLLFENRVGWARTYLKKAGLIELVTRGHYRITSRGTDILRRNPVRVDVALLRQFPEFLAFQKPKAEGQADHEEPLGQLEKETPLEILEAAYQRLRRELADEILQMVRGATPAFFERLVVQVLVAMGYGGSLKDAGEAVGKSGDGGIDGIIKEDRLGLDVVCIQAKRWNGPVGRPEVQAFAGSLEGHRARKGVFITTSVFSREARDYVTRIERRIVLIDGEQLAQLMIDCGVGVADVETYQVKKLDHDYFEGE